jgi:WD40 repeat protein
MGICAKETKSTKYDFNRDKEIFPNLGKNNYITQKTNNTDRLMSDHLAQSNNNLNPQNNNIPNPISNDMTNKNPTAQDNSKINYKCEKTIREHNDIIVCLIGLSSGNIATCSYDKTIKILDLKTFKCIREIKTLVRIFCLLEFEPGKLLCGTENKEIELYDINDINTSAKQNIVFQGHLLWVNCLAKCDAQFFASGSNDTDIRIWSYSTQQQYNVLSEHSKEVLALIILKDGRLCSGGADLSIKIWNWKDRKCEVTLIGHLRWIKCILELSNGKIISGSDDKTIRIWDINDQVCLNKLIEHEKSVRALCQLSDNLIASASFDKTIKIWDLNTKKCVQTLKDHNDKVVCLLQTSEYLISASGDKTIKFWKKE